MDFAGSHLGNPLFNDCLSEITLARDKLHKKVHKGKRERRKTKSGFDAISTFSQATQDHNNLGDKNIITKGISVDFGWTSGKPRAYKGQTKTLCRLGIEGYDKTDKIADLKLKMEEATSQYRKSLHTTSKDKIQSVIKLGIIREVSGLIERNEARKYASSKPALDISFSSDKAKGGDISIIKSSQETKSLSPSKQFNKAPILKKVDDSASNLKSVL